MRSSRKAGGHGVSETPTLDGFTTAAQPNVASHSSSTATGIWLLLLQPLAHAKHKQQQIMIGPGRYRRFHYAR